MFLLIRQCKIEMKMERFAGDSENNGFTGSVVWSVETVCSQTSGANIGRLRETTVHLVWKGQNRWYFMTWEWDWTIQLLFPDRLMQQPKGRVSADADTSTRSLVMIERDYFCIGLYIVRFVLEKSCMVYLWKVAFKTPSVKIKLWKELKN